jgi:hypothetical protein
MAYPNQEVFFIKDAYLVMKDTYQQVNELLSCHIQSLGENERKEFVHSDDSSDFASDYAIFREKIGEFIKNKVKHKLSSIV